MMRGHVYVMRSTAHPEKTKVGYSKNPKDRAKWISGTIKGDARLVFSVSLFSAYAVEQFLHGILAPMSTKMSGSGKTEWYRFHSMPVAFLLTGITFYALKRIDPQSPYLNPLSLCLIFVGSYFTSKMVVIFLLFVFLRIIQVLEIAAPLIFIYILFCVLSGNSISLP